MPLWVHAELLGFIQFADCFLNLIVSQLLSAERKDGMKRRSGKHGFHQFGGSLIFIRPLAHICKSARVQQFIQDFGMAGEKVYIFAGGNIPGTEGETLGGCDFYGLA